MAKRLLRFLTFLWFFSVLLLGVNGRGMSQSLGDIAFVEVGSSNNSFIIGIQNDLPANTTIFFTDAEWDGESFSNEGGIIRWQTGDEIISAGTIIFFEEINSNEIKVSTGNAYGSGIDIREGDRSLLAYTGSDWQIPSSLLAANINEYSNNRQEKLKNTDLWEQLERDIVEMPVQVADTNKNERIDIKEGLKLLSNPFPQPISVAALKEFFNKTGSKLNGHVYTWNSEFGEGNGRFEPLASHETIASFQAFWVYFKDGNVDVLRLNRAELVTEAEGERLEQSKDIVGNLKIQLGDGEQFDQYGIEFTSQAESGEDHSDVFKLLSLKRESINLFSITEKNNRLARNAIPHRLEEQLQIPLLFSAPDRERLTFNWEIPDNLPRDWDFLLLDREMDREIDLRTTNSYSFDLNEAGPEKNNSAETSDYQLFKDEEERVKDRFTLMVGPSGVGDSEINQETTESIQLKPNYPNPFTNSTTIPFELAEETEVSLTVWNMIGQKVETLTEGPRGAGSYDDVTWDASNMPSGMYIIRLEADGEVFTRKVTLIK